MTGISFPGGWSVVGVAPEVWAIVHNGKTLTTCRNRSEAIETVNALRSTEKE